MEFEMGTQYFLNATQGNMHILLLNVLIDLYEKSGEDEVMYNMFVQCVMF